MKKLSFVFLFFSLYHTSFSQKPIRFSTDKNGYIQIDNIVYKSSRSAYSGDTLPVRVSARPDANFNDRIADVRIDFSPEIDINKVRGLVMIYQPLNDISQPQDIQTSYDLQIYYSHKAIDKKERAFKTKLGGLKANTGYKIMFVVLMNNKHSYLIDQRTIVRTNVAPKDRTKRLLFIIDKELERDVAIDNALDQYMADVKNTDDFISFDKVYIKDNTKEKWNLYKRITKEYEDASAPLSYLFFIGNNASTTIERQYLDTTNIIYETYYDISVNFYTQVHLPGFSYDSLANKFLSKTYRYFEFEGLPSVDIGNSLYQSNAFDIAYGAIMPNSNTGKKQSILNYFSKLHDYKTLKLTFDKSVLFSDTFYNDGRSPADLAAISTRWKTNDTINISKKLEYGINNSWDYPQWTNDYLNKLSLKSYEISIYMGHGSPNLFFFGITPQVINNLPTTNTMVFDFMSCSVGDFTQYDYLAGKYLEKGNTLFVKAYTVPIGIGTVNYQSPLIEFFKKNTLYAAFEKGNYLGDCFLFNSQALTVQVHFGDPLLKLDPVQVQIEDIAANVCVGSIVEVPFKLNTKAAIETDYSIQISDKNGENYVTIPAERIGSSFRFKISENMELGTNYRLRVVASNKNIASIAGKSFTINRKPIVEVTRFERKDNFELVSSSNSGNHWFFEGEEIAYTTDSVYIPEKAGWYSVAVLEKGCLATSANKVFVGIERPAVTITGNNPACEGDNVKLTGPEGYNQYKWISAKDTTSTTDNQLIVKKSGLYQLIVMRGKIESYLSYSSEVVINTYPPKPIITIESIGLKSSSTANNQWFFNGTLLKDSTGQYIKGVYSGQYSVKVTEHGCATESAVFTITSFEAVLDDTSVKLYPNPGEGIFYVEIPSTFREWQLKIYNLEGKLLLSKERNTNNNREEINLKNKKGSYILQVTDGIKTKNIKFVVE